MWTIMFYSFDEIKLSGFVLVKFGFESKCMVRAHFSKSRRGFFLFWPQCFALNCNLSKVYDWLKAKTIFKEIPNPKR